MKTIVLDIETIPDVRAMQRAGYVIDDDEFAPWPLHELVCASAFTVSGRRWDQLEFALTSFSRRKMGERGIIASVEQLISNADRVLTYNGRGHDIPVLLARAIIAGEYVPTLTRLANTARPGLHHDLHDELRRRTGTSVKLAHICAAFSIPAKVDRSDRVLDAAEGGRWTDIEHYCETDVIATWLATQMLDSAENAGFGLECWRQLKGWAASESQTNPLLKLFCKFPEILGPAGRTDIAF